MEQGSKEWYEARLGKVTASRVADVVAKTKSGWGASRANYMAQLIAERLTGVPADSFTNSAMQWGTEKEPEARAAYEFMTDASVELVGFLDHPHIPMTGASPDGLIGTDGMIEIKCPNTATHIDTLLGQEIPQKYILQMQWQMECAGRQWCEFVSYDPRLPANMAMFTKIVERDETLLAELRQEIGKFLLEVDAKVNELRNKYERQQAA